MWEGSRLYFIGFKAIKDLCQDSREAKNEDNANEISQIHKRSIILTSDHCNCTPNQIHHICLSLIASLELSDWVVYLRMFSF